MKMRNGFVSNSSSSSFLIIGKEIDINKVTSETIKKKDVYALSYKYLSEGQDIFKIRNVEELAFLKSYTEINSDEPFLIMDTYFFGSENSGELDIRKLSSGKVHFYSGMVDYHSSYGLEDLKQRYDIDGDIIKNMQKYLRSKKINNIENKIKI